MTAVGTVTDAFVVKVKVVSQLEGAVYVTIIENRRYVEVVVSVVVAS